MLACDMAIALLPDLVLPMRKISSQQPPSWYLSITYQHLEVPRVTSGGSRRRECPASAKKPTRLPTGAVCRSCTTMPVFLRAPPPGGKTGTVFPDLVPGAGTLPVGFQGRSALVAPKERNPGSGRCKTGLLPGGGTDDVAALFELRYRIRVVQHAAFQAGQR